MFFKFGSWIVYFGFDGFYIERLGSIRFFVGCVNFRSCEVLK